jgi:hypothetical protein
MNLKLQLLLLVVPTQAGKKTWWKASQQIHVVDKSVITPIFAQALSGIRAAPNWSRLSPTNNMSSPDFCAYTRGLAWLASISKEDVDLLQHDPPDTISHELPSQTGHVVVRPSL